MPHPPSTKKQSRAEKPAPAMRRPRGAPRRLLLDAGRALFARQDYRSTTTREIPRPLASPNTCYSALRLQGGAVPRGLVLPFTNFVDEFGRTWQFGRPRGDRRG